MKIKLPTHFNVAYPKENRKYYSGNSKGKLRELLLAASKGYCMYCGKQLTQDQDRIVQIEHSVDKEGNINQKEKHTFLEHCKYNLALSCVKCNEEYKKRVYKIDFSKYDPGMGCPKDCTEMCDVYRKVREEYIQKNAIILQPQGTKRNDVQYDIVYSLLKHIYEPDIVGGNNIDKFIVQNHIDRFDLNGERFTYSIIDVCAEIVYCFQSGMTEMETILSYFEDKTYSNVVGEQFVKFLRKYFGGGSTDSMIRFCRMLVIVEAAI